jgi:CheY-like chemotaxis protein
MKTSQTILLVEDNSDDVFFMRRAFKHARIEEPLHVLTDGQQALEYLLGNGRHSDRNKHPLPGLVLLDLKLPYKTGLEVLQEVRAIPALNPLPILVLTSSSERSDVLSACKLGANAFIVKPSDPIALNDLAHAIKNFWLRFNHCPSCLVTSDAVPCSS